MEYAAIGIGFTRPVRPPVSKARVGALLKKQADARECVRLYRLKRAIAETPPHILREARLRGAMRDWLEQQDRLERRLAAR